MQTYMKNADICWILLGLVWSTFSGNWSDSLSELHLLQILDVASRWLLPTSVVLRYPNQAKNSIYTANFPSLSRAQHLTSPVAPVTYLPLFQRLVPSVLAPSQALLPLPPRRSSWARCLLSPNLLRAYCLFL